MSASPQDDWPTDYYVGPPKHLHAAGVLSTAFNSFEDRLFSLYRHHLDLLKVPYAHSEFVYLHLPEHERLNAIKSIFSECDKDPKVVAVVDNLVEYFQWCSDTRDKLAHAEFYPMSFARKNPAAWHLTKRMSRRNPKQGYMKLELPFVRDAADKVAYGTKHSARLQIYLRLRDIPHSELPRGYLDYANEPLPEILPIPDSITLSTTPEGDP
jgi:hypothetical protein